MKASFDQLAGVYDILSYLAFQGNIQRSQQYFLPTIPEDADVLFLGGGTGFLLPYLFQLNKIRRITYIEASIQMLTKAKKTVATYQKDHPEQLVPIIDFIHGSEKQIPEKALYSAVITNFVLDMYSDHALPHLMQRVHQHVTADAYWLFTDFRVSTRLLHRLWQRPLLSIMFWFFRLTAGLSSQHLPDYTRHFSKLGWHNTQAHSFFGDFIVARVYRLSTESKPDAFLLDRQ